LNLSVPSIEHNESNDVFRRHCDIDQDSVAMVEVNPQGSGGVKVKY
tara:strand:- start:697 stop:834 length:138 start_codon:yes stop_codon:yes gene_type:complete